MGTVSEEVLQDIVKNQPAYDDRVKTLFLTDEEFEKLKDPGFDLQSYRIEKENAILGMYRTIRGILKKFSDLDEPYYSLLSVWIMGTYLHQQFETYPYIFLNAMKGSGKTRLLKLVACLSCNGEVLASMKEAVLFRTNSTLAIDEFESIGRKNSDDLRELLNAAYKKGIKVKRMKKRKTAEGEEQVVEEFSVYRPIIMANIWGMENVLSDRCFTLILERSNDTSKTKLVELFDSDSTIKTLKSDLKRNLVSLCHVVVAANIYKDWNEYVLNHNNNNIITGNNNDTKQHFFDKINDSGIDGRQLELSLPLLLIGEQCGEEVFDELLQILSDISLLKKDEDFLENKDISLYDFISQELPVNNFISLKDLMVKFRNFLQEESDVEHPINEKWLGRALKRLKLIKKQRRMSYGRVVILDYLKAQEKIKMFR